MTIYRGRVKYDIAVARDVEGGIIRKTGYAALKLKVKKETLSYFSIKILIIIPILILKRFIK